MENNQNDRINEINRIREQQIRIINDIKIKISCGKFEEAIERLNALINKEEMENGYCDNDTYYWLRLMAKRKVRSEDELASLEEDWSMDIDRPTEKDEDFLKAMSEYASKTELEKRQNLYNASKNKIEGKHIEEEKRKQEEEIKRDFDIQDGVLVKYKGNTKKVVIPNSVESIGDESFSDCSSLTCITIPDSVKSIGKWAFDGCSLLENIYYTGTIDDWVQIEGIDNLMRDGSSDKKLFINNELLTEANITTATVINDEAFSNCHSLTTITIPKSVKSIGKWAFDGCISLTNITVDESNEKYKSIDGNLYSKDGKTLIQYAIGKTLTAFEIPKSVTSIGDWAFLEYSNLTSVTIHDNVDNIGVGVFCNCSSLTNIKVAENNENYKSIDGNLYSRDGKTLIQYAIGKKDKSFEIPNDVTSIKHGAFYKCSSLTSVTIGDSVKSIKDYAFEHCSSLTSVTIGDSVTSIGEGAFDGCSSLKSITIPKSVTSIKHGAFVHSTSIKGQRGSYAETYAEIWGYEFEEIKK